MARLCGRLQHRRALAPDPRRRPCCREALAKRPTKPETAPVTVALVCVPNDRGAVIPRRRLNALGSKRCAAGRQFFEPTEAPPRERLLGGMWPEPAEEFLRLGVPDLRRTATRIIRRQVEVIYTRKSSSVSDHLID